MRLVLAMLLAAVVLAAAIFVWMALPARTQIAIPAGLSSQSAGMAERGAYVIRAGGCISCHTDKKHGGALLAGGRELETPFGVFVTPNLTPDRDTGIGAWTDEDFVRALLAGEGTHGEQLYPVFPYTSYSCMSIADALAIKAYLFSLPPVKREIASHRLNFPFSWRGLMSGWKLLFFSGPSELKDDPSRDATWNRGRYLVTALGHCAECHSPRNVFGAIDHAADLKGNRNGPEGWAVPALVGPSKSNFAQWSVEEIAEYLKSGGKPDFDSAQGPMAEVIADDTRHLTDEDRLAVARYLKSLNQ
jgi:mono/diheme cytochrome c family protein